MQTAVEKGLIDNQHSPCRWSQRDGVHSMETSDVKTLQYLRSKNETHHHTWAQRHIDPPDDGHTHTKTQSAVTMDKLLIDILR